MDREFFNYNWAALISAFPNSKVTPESQDIYWMMLKELPEEMFNKGVKKCLTDCIFFPSIHELGETSVPPVIETYPYNAHVYREPRKLAWTEALKRRTAKGLPDVNDALAMRSSPESLRRGD